MVSVTKHCGGLATKPGFDFRHLNWPLLRANKASPVLFLFATLIVHDKHVSSQDLNMQLRAWGCMPVGAGDTETSFLHVMLSLYIRGMLCSFFLPNGFRPSLSLGCRMLFPFTPSVMGITWMYPCCRRTQTPEGRSYSSLIFDLWTLLSKEALWSATLSGARPLKHARSWSNFNQSVWCECSVDLWALSNRS